MGKYDFYNAYKLMFIHDESRPSLMDFGKAQGLDDIQAFIRFAKREDWEFFRDKYWLEVAQRVHDNMIGLQVHDNTLKLRQIQAMKAKSWDGVFQTEFKSARDAVASYVDLEKLERLILGESTENVSVAQMENYMLKVVRIIKEEVS